MATPRKPRAGSLPLPKDEAPALHSVEPWWNVARRSGYTMTEEELQPFKDAFAEDLRRREKEATFSALQKARAKAEELTGALRTAAFDDWVRRCVVDVKTPTEWTQARTLYENYIAHAQQFGDNRAQRAQSVQALATETQWGRMMATLYLKKRRTKGWYYPVKLKRGA